MRTLLLALLLCVTSAFAQYPNKPIRMIVPLVPGGNQDIVARAACRPALRISAFAARRRARRCRR